MKKKAPKTNVTLRWEDSAGVEISQASDAWKNWRLGIEDYWETFKQPYRQEFIEAIAEHTPEKGHVIEMGCGVGVNLFLLHLRRPDLGLAGTDVNPQAINYTRLLNGASVHARTEDFNLSDHYPQVHTICSMFALAYVEPTFILPLLKCLSEKADTLVLAEPSRQDGHYEQLLGFPCVAYAYDYERVFHALGRKVETRELTNKHTPDNLLHIITKA